MTARVPDDHTAGVRDLLAELGELVGDLGLDEPAEAAAPAPAEVKQRRPRKRAAAAGGRRAAAVGGGAPRGAAVSPAAEGSAAVLDAAAPPAEVGAASTVAEGNLGVLADAEADGRPSERSSAPPAAEDLPAEHAVTSSEATNGAEEPVVAVARAEEPSAAVPATARPKRSARSRRAPKAPAPSDPAPPDAVPLAPVFHLHREPLAAEDAAELAELAAAVAADAPLTGADSAGLIPLWESSADATEHEPELVPLWDAFAPELDAEPPRAWSLEAAMEVVEPAAPPRAPGDPRAPVLLRLTRAVRPRIFTVTVVAAVLVALAVVVFSRLDLSQTTGPAQPVSKAAFAVTVMRTVDATSAAAVAQAPTLSTFPAHTTQVYMDVAYRNATQGDTLRLVIDLLPPAGSGGNPVPVGDQTHQLPLGGEIAVTIQGPASGFSPGSYTVTAFHDGHLEQSLTFSVAANGSATASPTP